MHSTFVSLKSDNNGVTFSEHTGGHLTGPKASHSQAPGYWLHERNSLLNPKRKVGHVSTQARVSSLSHV